MESLVARLGQKLPFNLEPGPDGALLVGRQGRSAVTVQGWPSVVFGLLFAAVGCAILAATFGYLPVKWSAGRQPPIWIMLSIGFVFAYSGAPVVVQGLIGVRRSSRMRRLRAAHPTEPWRWDHPWDARGATDDTGVRAGQLVAGAVFIFIFLTPFHWIGFVARDGSVVFGLFALLFDAMALAFLGRGVYLLARRLKYGGGRALFARFPFRPGMSLEMHVEAPRALPQHALATATLRCIQEQYVTHGRGEDASVTVRCFEKYRDVTPAELVTTAAGRSLRVRFDLPRDLPTTDLSTRPCRYWELEITASTDGVDYAARYLVPVY